MNTYFIRHTSELDVDNDTLKNLWKEGVIAIHFPRARDWQSGDADSSSLDPADYDGAAKSCLARMHELAKHGGYVFAAYRNQPGAKVGYVSPGSKVEIISGKWGNRNNQNGRDAILKGIRLSRETNLDAAESIALKAGQPRQGTFCKWRRIGSRVRNLVDGKDAAVLECLTPDLQEVMCMEYLRTELPALHDLPRLKLTLAPVGRTLKDIDIFGLSSDDRKLFAQVTHGNDQRKLRKLDAYRKGGEHHTIFFCQANELRRENGHHVVPISIVFEEFCLGSDQGRRWFEYATGINVKR